jgi:hypothetical protein
MTADGLNKNLLPAKTALMLCFATFMMVIKPKILRGWIGKPLLSSISLLGLFCLLSPLPYLGWVFSVLAIYLIPGGLFLSFLGLNFDQPISTICLSFLTGLFLTPTVVYLASLLFGFSWLTTFCSLCLMVVGFGLFLTKGQPLPWFSRTHWQNWNWRLVIFLSLFLILIAIPQWAHQGESPLWPVIGDFPKHFGVTFSLLKTGIPPENPFLRPGASLPLPYYHLYQLGPATLVLITGHSFEGIATALMINSMVLTLSLLGCFWTLSLSLFRSRVAAWISLFLISIFAGFDAIPMFAKYVLSLHSGSFVTQWFDQMTIMSYFWSQPTWNHLELPFGNYFWVPHHMQAISSLLLIPLILLYSKAHPIRQLGAIVFLAACLPALSVYIAILFLIVFLLTLCIPDKAPQFWDLLRQLKIWQALTIFGCALLLFFPMFFYMLFPSLGSSYSKLVLALPTTFYQEGSLLERSFGIPFHSIFLDVLGLLSIQMGLSLLGLVFLVGCLIRKKGIPLMSWWVSAFAVSLFLSLFVRSTGHYNDLGMRSLTANHLILSLFAGPLLAWLWRVIWKRSFFAFPGVLLLSALLILPSLHAFVGQGLLRFDSEKRLTERNKNFIQTCGFIRNSLPPDAVIQSKITKLNYLLYLSHHFSALLDEEHGPLFATNREVYKKTKQLIEFSFADPQKEASCRIWKGLQIDYLLVAQSRTPLDPWISSPCLATVFQNDDYAIYAIHK